ncbi:MAG: hypothetical protein JW888_07295 [Pirellulales bacterium]|nr:hypothetical protein [Pirellulales bacterium]
MSVEAPPPKSLPPAVPAAGESLIDDRLRNTRRQLRGVDVAAGLLKLAIGVIGYLFLWAVADHWVFVGGLATWARFLVWLVLLVVGVGYLWLRIVRPLLWQINPVYVAQTIEQSRPTLKNSLINILLLRKTRLGIPAAVSQEIERHAAAELVHVSPETAVDRHHVIVLAYVLAGLVAVGAVYHVVSPKNPLTSALRMALPWIGTDAPTRVWFDDIQPGDCRATRGEVVVVSAQVHGLREGEPAMLYFTTADRQSVDQAVPMTIREGRLRHEATLPPDSFGLQQNLTYYLTAGDYRSPEFTVAVETAPTFLAESMVVDYDYPDYTGLATRTVRRQGDLRAIEGTRITIQTDASTRIKRAEIDLGCRGLRGVPMVVDDHSAKGSFRLRMSGDKPMAPEYDSYRLLYTDVENRKNRRPIRYRIEVIADLPPEVRLVDPPADHIQLPVNGILSLTVRAEDPDFALREVGVHAVLGERSLPIRPLLRSTLPSPPHEGVFEGIYRFEPAQLGLKPGDEVRYRAEAKDNRTPLPGRAETDWRQVTIVEADPNQPNDEQQENQPGADPNQKPEQKSDPDQSDSQPQPDQADQSGDQPQPDQPDQQPDTDPQQKQGQEDTAGQEETKQQDQPDETQQGDDPRDQPGQKPEEDSQDQSDQPSEPIDGETNPGDVIQKALEKRDEEKNQQDSPQQENDQQAEEPDQDNRKPGEEKSSEEKTGEEKTGEEKTGEEKTGEEKTGEEKTGEEKTGEEKTGGQETGGQETGGQETGEKKTGEEKAGDQKTGGQETGGQETGEKKTGEERAGEEKGGEEKVGKQEGGGKKSGEQETGEQKGGEEQGDKENVGDQKTGDQETGDRKTGEEKTGEERGGEEKGGEERSGDQKGGEQKDHEDDPSDPSDPDDEGRRLDPDEVEPNMKGTPEGTTDKAPNARAKVPQVPGGGGRPGEPLPPPSGEEPGEDPFNREYAEQRTILALEYLKDQLAKEKPDQKLLDSLGGWTRDDLAKFTQRWEAMFRAARQPGSEGQKAQARLNEALKSLGLRGGRAALRGGASEDKMGGLRGPRDMAPPPDWEEQVRAYHRAIGRDKQDK